MDILRLDVQNERMIPRRAAMTALIAAALATLSLGTAPVASATTGPQIDGFACSVSEVNDMEANFQCDLSWTDGTGPFTVTAHSVDYASVDWVVVSGNTATIYGGCRVGKYLTVYATVSDSTSAADSTYRGGYCRQ